MGANSKISWTDHTFNPWVGCTKVSPGCKFCYAEMMGHRYGKVQWRPQGARVRTSEANWKKPLAWNKRPWMECLVCGWRGSHPATSGLCPVCQSPDFVDARQRVFCASLADVFENNAQLYDWRDELFGLIEQTPNLDWLILTKRPEYIIPFIPTRWLSGLPPNIWIGVSVENREAADRRIPELLKIPARVRFLSVEPMLERVDIRQTCMPAWDSGKINLVIVGGESGPKARPFEWDWARSIRDQCREAGVAYFMKQGGGHPNKRERLEDIPQDLRIREFPK